MAAVSKKNKNKADIDINGDLDDFEMEDDFKGATGSKKAKAEKSGGNGGVIAFIIVIFLLIGLTVGILVFNLFGLRDNQLRGFFERVPIVNNLLPPLEAGDPLLQMSAEELQAEIALLKDDNEKLSAEGERLKALNETYLNEISVLKEFERNQLQFKKDKEEFDRTIGFGNTVDFEAYYRQVSPENAENIYREVIGINSENKEFKSFVSTYENMDETSAAKIFDQMVRTDLELVVSILKNISSEQRAAILAAMTTSAAEQATRHMAPQNY